MDQRDISAMLRPLMVTARASGLSLVPLQTGQGRVERYFSSSSLMYSLLVSV